MKKLISAKLGNSKNYTLEVANAMPSENYDFKPTDPVWSFRELMNHVGYGIHWYKENYIEKTETAWEPPLPLADKAKTIAYVTNAFNALETALNKTELNDDVIAGFYFTLDHITHHRGQATTYLRCNGITPPEYIY